MILAFYFFIRNHIKHQINEIILEKFKNAKIKLKYGIPWYDKHIINYKSEYKNYSFASNYYDSLSIEKKIKIRSRKSKLKLPLEKRLEAIEGLLVENPDLVFEKYV